jgi:hypothetical protein
MRLPFVVNTVVTGAKAHVRRLLRSRDLQAMMIRPGCHDSHHIAVVVVKNERPRFDYLLTHYRGLGIEHFIVIDNMSTDGLDADLSRHEDVTLYRARGDYRKSRFGIDWVNVVLFRHGRGKWVLHVDADEFLVYEDHDRVPLSAVCGALEREGRRSSQALLIDLYSDGSAQDSVLAAGQNPLELTPLFDGSGYESRYDPRMLGTWIKGGVRGRVFFAHDRWAGPALNKTPLVRWRRDFAFVKSAHELWPRSLNGGRRRPELGLLHFKFTSVSISKMQDAEYRSQHTLEYEAYAGAEFAPMVDACTLPYKAPSSLISAGLIDRISGL